jgi:O-antigen/teichoic acid export membrane protein
LSAEIRSLGKHAAIYGFGNALAKLASFLMLPIYTRYLTVADYGTLELLSMTIDLIGILAGITLSSAVYRFYHDYEEVGEEKEVVSTAAIGMIVLAIITAIAGIIAAPWLNHFVLRSHGEPVYFRLFFLIYITQTAEVVPFLMCRALRRSKLVVSINLLRLVALLSLNILFVVYLRLGVLGILFSTLIVSTCVATGMLVFLFRNMGMKFSWPKYKEMVKYAYPVAFVSIGNFFLVFSDRYFVNHYAGVTAVGIYSLAYRFGMILSAFVYNPFQQIWGPQRFAIAKRPDARDIYRRVFLYINIGLGVVALLIALFVRDFIKVMAAPAFHGAYVFVPLILIVQIIHHWTAYNNLGLFLTKTTKKFALGSMVAIPSVIILNILLIPRYGVWGAIAATLLAYTLRFGVMQWLSQRQYRINYDWARIARLYAIIVTAFIMRAVAGNLQIVPSVAIGLLLATAALSVIYAFILNRDERRGLHRIIRGRIPAWLRRSSKTPETPLVVRERPAEITIET